MSDRVYREIATLLNANPKMADKMDLKQLAALLEAAEEAYSNATSEPILDDAVYDYALSIYEKRSTSAALPPTGKSMIRIPPSASAPLPPAGKSMIPPATATGITAPEPEPELAHVPAVRGPTIKLPYWMGSMTKVVHGTEDAAKWAAKFPGPYVITAKMDGASALYTASGSLISRGKGVHGQDISELLKYLHLPAMAPGMAVRGELILKKSVFQKHFKRADEDTEVATAADDGKYSNARNAVSGLVNSVGQRSKSINTDLATNLHFIVYEIVQAKLFEPSVQLKMLEEMGFEVVPFDVSHELNDEILSDELDLMMEDIDYEMDGLVIYSDHKYTRNTSGNPDYARAYKKALESLMKPAKVRSIEWNVTRHSYIKPVVIVEPVKISGVIISRITGNNAKFIVDNGLGPGAEVLVIRSNDVIPKIFEVRKKVEPELPKMPYKWNPTHVDLLYDGPAQGEQQDEESISTKREVAVEKLYFFAKTIGAKGVGIETISKIYDAGFKRPANLLTLKASEIAFLGPKTSVAVVESIRTAINRLTLPTMMAASGMFGRGMGVKRFEAIIAAFPDIVDSEEAREGGARLKSMIQSLPTFAEITAGVVAEGFPKFIKFFTEDIPDDIAIAIQSNTVDVTSEKEMAAAEAAAGSGAGSWLSGKNVVLTGFRDAEMQRFIELHGGKIQSAFSGTTNILIIKDSSVSNKKTEAAAAKGTQVMTKDEFKRDFM